MELHKNGSYFAILSLKKIGGQLCDPKNALLFASWCTQLGRNFYKVQAKQTCEMKQINFTIFHFLRGKIMIFMYSKSYLWNWFICCYHNFFA